VAQKCILFAKKSILFLISTDTITLSFFIRSNTGVTMKRSDERTYRGEQLHRVAFPLGGIGAGMFCLEGNGSLSHMSLRHRPDIFNQPSLFATVAVKADEAEEAWEARILQGKTPDWKVNFPFKDARGSGCGGFDRTFGYPYFRENSFSWAFPFAAVNLADETMPLSAEILGWSPFIPGVTDDSSLPMGALEYSFTNNSQRDVEAVFTFAAKNFMAESAPEGATASGAQGCGNAVLKTENGFILHQDAYPDAPKSLGDFSVVALEEAQVNCRWFRGGWFDAQTLVWKSIAQGECVDTDPYDDGEGTSPGGTLTVSFTLAPQQSKTIRLLLNWYVPYSDLREGHATRPPLTDVEQFYRPWYASRFANIEEVIAFSKQEYARLYAQSEQFSDQFFSLDVPAAVTEAAGANLAILKSPTVLRQFDGRFWAWEGCNDTAGSCHGSCTHVWNYAQAVAHLFPDLERTIREGEFGEAQSSDGHQAYRIALPIATFEQHDYKPAADGQLGTMMKVHRDWRISGDDAWLRGMWPQMVTSIEYCIAKWDPDEKGLLVEPHHNTYDIEFWGADGMCTSVYLGALKAMMRMGSALGEDVERYTQLYRRGRTAMESDLFNGEYFIQRVQVEGLRSPSPIHSTNMVDPAAGYKSAESLELLAQEGPKYQYGEGCLSDGVIGAWMAAVCGVGEILDPEKVKSHLLSVYTYNFRESLYRHANPQRQTYALNEEAGLLICTWPKGGELSLPFVYSNEIWTGIEYQVASHLALVGEREKALAIVEAVRNRYNGVARNPFNEYESGYWYARALSSYALLQGFGVSPDFNQR
jgi:uncharacterized protein (DUF608 family)